VVGAPLLPGEQQMEAAHQNFGAKVGGPLNFLLPLDPGRFLGGKENDFSQSSYCSTFRVIAQGFANSNGTISNYTFFLNREFRSFNFLFEGRLSNCAFVYLGCFSGTSDSPGRNSFKHTGQASNMNFKQP